jgi:uncharacterized protein (TIGR02099 family)
MSSSRTRRPFRPIRWLVKLAIVLFIIVAVLWLMALAALRFVIIPNVDGFKPRLTDFLQTSIGHKVEIGALEAGWEGWNPRFVMHQLKLMDKDGRVGLLLPRVEKVVSWRSLPNFRLTSQVLTIDGLRVVIRRDAGNRISIAGLDLDNNKSGEADPRFADWLLDQRSVQLRNAQIVWQDAYRAAPPIELKDLNARLVNSGNRHRLGVTASWSDNVASPIQLIADVNGDTVAKVNDWSGQLYVRMDEADIARMRLWIPLPFPVQSGVGGFQAWIGLNGGKPNDVTADVRLAHVQAQIEKSQPALALQSLSGRMHWSEASATANSLTTVRTENVTAVFPDQQKIGPISLRGLIRRNADGSFNKNELQFNGFDLAALNRLLAAMPVPEAFARPLTGLQPRGEMGETSVEWTGDPLAPKAYTVSTSVKNLSLNRMAPYPGVSGVTGTVKLTEHGGTLDLTGAGATIDFPSVLNAPVKLDTLKSQVKWAIAQNGIEVDVRQAELSNADMSVSLSGKWSRKANAPAPGVADFAGVINRGKADRVWAYLPPVIEKPVRDYVQNALLTGKLTRGDFVLRGPLEKFPFANDEFGQWRISARAEDVDFDYADHWPKVTDGDVTLTVSGTRLVADVANGKITDVPVRNLRASIADLSVPSPQMSIVGTANGKTTQFLKFIDVTPVGDWIEHFTRDMGADGEGQLSLGIELPLGKTKSTVGVRGEYEFRDNTLRLGGDIPVLNNVRGKLLFTEKTTSAKDLQARVLGGPASFVLSNATGGIKVSGTGVADLAQVKAAYDYPYLDRLTGQADWALDVDTQSGGNFTLKSSLREATVNAPAPLGKPAGEVRQLTVSRSVLPNKRDAITVDYGNDLSWAMRVQQVGNERKLVAGALSVGGAKAAAVGEQGVVVRVAQATVDVAQWKTLIRDLQGSTPPGTPGAAGSKLNNATAGVNIGEVRIETDKLVADGHTLSKVAILARPVGEGWAVDLRSQEGDGAVSWKPGAAGGNGSLVARLTKLVIAPKPVDGAVVDVASVAASTAPVIPPAVANAKDWPALDLIAEDFNLRGKAMGRLELVAVPAGTDWRIDKMNVSNPDAELRASGLWKTSPSSQETTINAQLTISDTARYFARLGLGEGIRDSTGTVGGKLSWSGSPADFELKAVNGEFKLELTAGRFTKADPGIAKLLGIISLQSIGRRFLFDFRDLFSDGFVFDNAGGTVQIKKGVLQTENFNIFGPTARVEIRGQASMPLETQDLNVRILPDVSTSAAVGAGIVTANPLIGAGVFIASKVFKDPLDKAVSVKMKVTGTWSEPKVEGNERSVAANTASDISRQ